MATNRTLQISVDGTKEMRAVLKGLGDRALLKELGAENQHIARMIVAEAQKLAGGGREEKVASRLAGTKTAAGVSIRLPQLVDVNDKRGLRPVGTGTEFGAYRNKRRLVKNTGGRKTIVRDNENLDAVIRRVENQTIMRDRFGGASTMPKRYRKVGAEAVKVTKVIRGWNGFRPWRGNGGRAGYFLFPAVRRNREKAIEMYMAKIEDIWSRRKAA